MNWELLDVQAGFRKGRGTKVQIDNIHWIIEKSWEFQKNIYVCLIDDTKVFLWITTNCGKFLKRWEYQTTWHASWEICIQVKKQRLELDMEKQTGSKSGKVYVKIVYCHPTYLTDMRGISYKMHDWVKHNMESRECLEKCQKPQICRWHNPYGRKWKGTKEPLDEGERREWKMWLKTQHSKNEDHGVQSRHFMANKRE